MRARILTTAAALCAMSACGGEVPLNNVDSGATGQGDEGGKTVTSDAKGGYDVFVSDDAPQGPTPFTGDGATQPSGCTLGINVTGVVYRFYPDGTAYPFRPANLNPNDIDQQDCDDDIYLEFTLLETCLPTTDTIQVWAGTTDCSQATAREGATGGPYCWQVASNGQFQNSQTVTGKIYARNIVQYLDDTSVTDFAPPTTIPGSSVCQRLGNYDACEAPLSLYFLFVENDGITVDSATVYGQDVDVGGSPCAN
jgi:hypothetical protein